MDIEHCLVNPTPQVGRANLILSDLIISYLNYFILSVSCLRIILFCFVLFCLCHVFLHKKLRIGVAP